MQLYKNTTGQAIRSGVIQTFSILAVWIACISSVNGEIALTIHDKPLSPVRETIFGQFMERPSWDQEFGPEAVCDEHGHLSDEILKYLKGMHTTIVRFPAGTDADYMDWTDMINPPDRSPRRKTVGHTGTTVSNVFGYHEYFEVAEAMGWSTILVTNLRDALYKKTPLDIAASHAAELVAYCGADASNDLRGRAAQRAANGRKAPWKIHAVQVGNEGWFYWPPKQEEWPLLGLHSEADCAAWLHEVLIAYADAIHGVRPDLPLIADAPRQKDGGGSPSEINVWRLAVDNDEIRSRYHMLAAHAYAPLGTWTVDRGGVPIAPSSLSQDDVWYAMIACLGRFDSNGQAVADAPAYAQIKSMGFGAAVTEWNWNGWDTGTRFPNMTFDDGLPAALATAGFIHGLMRQPEVELATQSMMLGTTWGITSVRVGKDGSVGYLPQAEAVRFIAEFHGQTVLESRLDNTTTVQPARLTTWWPQVEKMGLVDTLVTSDERSIYIHCIERHRTSPLELTVRLPPSCLPQGDARIHLLSGSAAASTKSAGGMKRTEAAITFSDRRITVALPPASISVIVVPRK